MRFYGVDLWDVITCLADDVPTRWSPRQLMMLVDGLPQDSATVVSVRGEEYFGWSVTDEILADLWDLTITGLMAGAKKKPPKYPRPGDVKKQREKRKATSGGPAGILAMLPPDVRAAHEAARAARRKG